MLTFKLVKLTINNKVDDTLLMEMVDPELLERTQSFYKIKKRINVFSAKILEDVYDPATMMLACTGITRFCLDTMDAQFDTTFTELLERQALKNKVINYSKE